MEQQAEEIRLFDYINVLLKYRWMIVRNVVVAALAMGIISFFLPRVYTAKTSLLPPDETPESGLLSTLEGMPFSQLGLSPLNSKSDLFVQILRSRTVFDEVLLTQFSRKNREPESLLSVLGLKSIEKGRKVLGKATSIAASPEGVVSIKVELSDPQLAADVANAFVASLDKVNKAKSISRAKNSRIYIEQQLQITEDKLKQASGALASFEQTNKAVSLEEQTRTAIEKAGEIKGSLIAREVELGVALQTMKPNNVLVIQMKREIEELKKQYNYMQYGDTLSSAGKGEFYIPFSKVPNVGLELAKLIREVKVQEKVWELLNQQFYQAKIQEAKDTPTVQVLDEAIPPESRTRPNRKLIILISGFLSLLASIFWAFASEYFFRMKSEPDVEHMVRTVKGDVRLIRQRLQNAHRKK